MDNLESLFEKKQYDLVIKLTESSSDPKERFMRLSCFVILGKDKEALDEIETYQKVLETNYPAKLMKLHFELLLKNRLFDEANIALKHYQDLPYISQEVEEFLRSVPERIDAEKNQKNKFYTIDEVCEVLETENDSAIISEVLFSLKNYNLNQIIDSLKVFMKRSDVNPNFRTFAFIVLVDNKYDEDVELLTKNGVKKLNAKKVMPPFSSKAFNEITKSIYLNSERNITVQETALHLVNCYSLDVYPDDMDLDTPENMSKAFIMIAKDYIHEDYDKSDEHIASLKEKIRAVIESTPAIKL